MPNKLAVITSITGAQARAIAGRFAEAGYDIRGLSRSAADTNARFEQRQTDPNNEAAMTAALDGADAVVFTSPIDYRDGVRERLAETLVRAAAKAGVRRIVFNAAAAVIEDYDRPVSRSLRAVRDIILAGPVEAVAIQPTVYMDNLIEPWSAPAIVNDGVFAYPMPDDAPVSWISHASLGLFAVAAAQASLTKGRIYDIGGAGAYTGPQIAAILSRTIGRDVRYVPLEPGVFGEGLNAFFGPPVGDHIADLYRYLHANKQAMARDPAAYAALGVAPESFETWAARQQWPTAGKPAAS